MPDLIPWFERVFKLDIADALFPNILERLRGTPARLEERLGAVPQTLLIRKKSVGWSIMENAGHLLDLESLWAARVQDFIQGNEKLQVADLTNRKTHEAGHNDSPPERIFFSFRSARGQLVKTLEELNAAVFFKTALHPRLKTPMRLVDHMLFVAEHDDHHLARISILMSSSPHRS